MLRQLARLTRPVLGAAPGALAVAVYADGDDETIAAAESEFEGVACVDDAARLLGLLCRVWRRAPDDRIRDWALGLVSFLVYMQEDDGHWLNFVFDWDGKRNEMGATSSVGANFWHGRAMCGLSRAWITFGDERAHAAIQKGLVPLRDSEAPSDVRALHLELALRLATQTDTPDLDAAIKRWAHEIASRRDGDILMNNPDERGTPHLWAHVQEGVLAEAGAFLKNPALIAVAERSARALLEPQVQQSFDRSSTTPYDVASAVFSFDRLAAITGAARWESLAADARGWFDGRNSAGVPAYDRVRGRVADGIDDRQVSRNSGAEANIEAGSALVDAAVASAALSEELLPAT